MATRVLSKLCLLGLSWCFVGCASDPVVQRWATQWLEQERAASRGDAEAPEQLAAIALEAPTLADADAARFGQARALRRQGRESEAFRLFERLGNTAMRRMDRARARYEMARMAAGAGRSSSAITLFNQVVETYPNQPAAMRSLQYLKHLIAAGGRVAEAAALAWSRRAYQILASTPVGDDLAFLGAQITYDWWRASGRNALAVRAEALLLTLSERHRVDGHWDDAVWLLSRLYHRQGRYADEIRVLGLILSTREKPLFVGHYDTTYHWVGQLRIARIYAMALNDPVEAAATYEWFISTFKYSRWRDDARFWQGCMWLRAGQPEEALESFDDIANVYPHSKYLSRIEAAHEDPHGAVCVPKEFEEGSW